MIVIGLGANLPTASHGGPRETLTAALARLEKAGVRIRARSSWYATAPVPASDQPDFINAVAAVATDLGPRQLLTLLHSIETEFGRVRTVRNAARGIDLDLLIYETLVSADQPPILPHPRMTERAFVLYPLAELLDMIPDPEGMAWRLPGSNEPIGALLARLPPDQRIRRLDAAGC